MRWLSRASLGQGNRVRLEGAVVKRELFPPPPRGLKGRASDLATLSAGLTPGARIALVGAGGSGKSMLAAALAHRVSSRFGGLLHWFRIGAWDYRTLIEMLALRFGTTRERAKAVPALLAALREPSLLVLDNHEDDAATARLLMALSPSPTTFIITARRCLLSGVLLFPVTAPQVTSGASAFPRVASLTKRLRWSPLALSIADAIVASGAATAASLGAYLTQRGVSDVHVMEHEDDLPEVALLVAWAWSRLAPGSRRALGVLAHAFGDDMDVASLMTLARTRDAEDIAALRRWLLVQEPAEGRLTVHAVVRHAVRKRTKAAPERTFEHYIRLLEQDPSRVRTEQTHLFAAMDHAHRISDMQAMLRVEKLLSKLEGQT